MILSHLIYFDLGPLTGGATVIWQPESRVTRRSPQLPLCPLPRLRGLAGGSRIFCPGVSKHTVALPSTGSRLLKRAAFSLPADRASAASKVMLGWQLTIAWEGNNLGRVSP